ncbi:MaoC/PaaZ C-terminal domain-containing protein [Pseudovibrio exalbescens]|uniref:MaoC family dehydratase n=1 Tax=Pseudovibrio exalbescens TaxID=197461 RepID=UPI00236569F8|nr:MaoC/PaaZ C-terminal domain-containing protein [Pseudovibrio exalbescens]MDD7909642.1 MaoC/PaaZ C-terminal domain-containing protein [Pseudovibrio exalbescens]
MSVLNQSIQERWVPTQQDFDDFAELSGDDNPIHVDPEFSARTRFGRTVSHGMLLYTRLFGLLKREWPDFEHAFQALVFPNPTYAGEEVIFSLTSSEEDPNKIVLEAKRGTDNKPVLTGECLLSGGAA